MTEHLVLVEGDRSPVNFWFSDANGSVDLSASTDLPWVRVDDTVISQLGATIPGDGFANGYLLAHRQTSLGDHTLALEVPVTPTQSYRFPSTGSMLAKVLPSTRRKHGDGSWTPVGDDTDLLFVLYDAEQNQHDPLSPSRRLKVSGTSVAADEAGYLEAWLHRGMSPGSTTRTLTWETPAAVAADVDFGMYEMDRGVIDGWAKFTKTGESQIVASVRVGGTTYTDTVNDATNLQFQYAWNVQIHLDRTTGTVEYWAGADPDALVQLTTPNITAVTTADVFEPDWLGLQGTVADDDLLFTSITLADT